MIYLTKVNAASVLAQLSSNASILEVGCGPGNATVAFAPFGFAMTCLEPNPDFCRLARYNCAPYLNVAIYNTSFEEWKPSAKQFNAVLSANAFHWVSPEMRYAKAAQALRDNGFLILLWNMTPEPKYEVYQAIADVYQAYGLGSSKEPFNYEQFLTIRHRSEKECRDAPWRVSTRVVSNAYLIFRDVYYGASNLTSNTTRVLNC